MIRPDINASDAEFDVMSDESDVMSILLLSVSSDYTDDLREKSAYEVIQKYEGMFQEFSRTGRSMAMIEVLSNKTKEEQYVGDHLVEMRKQLKSFKYPVTEDQLVLLIYYSLTADYQASVEESVKKGDMTIVELHEIPIGINNNLKLKNIESENIYYMEDEDWLNDICCPDCGSKDSCEHTIDIRQLDIVPLDDIGIFMIECLFTSHES